MVRNMRAVQKTGFCGTEGIFGTGNALLWYGVHHSVRRLFSIAVCDTTKRKIGLWIVSQADFMHNISLSPQMA